MNINKSIIVLLCCLSISSCASMPGSDDSTSANTFLTLLQNSQAMSSLALAPSQFYCQHNQWPTTSQVMSYPFKDNNPLQFIAGLTTSIDSQNRYLMHFHLKGMGSSSHSPVVDISVSNPPTATDCKSLTIQNVQITVNVPNSGSNTAPAKE